MDSQYKRDAALQIHSYQLMLKAATAVLQQSVLQLSSLHQALHQIIKRLWCTAVYGLASQAAQAISSAEPIECLAIRKQRN